MTADARPDDRQPTPVPLDEKVDHVPGSPADGSRPADKDKQRSADRAS
jgi:hypothetical protein